MQDGNGQEMRGQERKGEERRGEERRGEASKAAGNENKHQDTPFCMYDNIAVELASGKRRRLMSNAWNR